MKTTLIAMFVLTIAVWLPAPATAQESSWLTEWLSQHKFGPDTLEPLRAHPSANRPLTRAEADAARKQLWEARRRVLRESRADEMQQRQVTIGDHTMPFWYKVFGEKPADGRRLFISMHGGGGAPARVNDSQYENQKRLYQPEEGVYLVPRAPTDTWNL